MDIVLFNKFNNWINVTSTRHNTLIIKKYTVITPEEFRNKFYNLCSYEGQSQSSRNCAIAL